MDTQRAELVRRLVRYAIVGVTVTVVFMALNALFDHWLRAQTAFLVAYVPAVTLHFCLNKWWTFGCQRTDSTRQVAEYLVMVGVTFVVQWAVFTVVHDIVGVRAWLAAGVANVSQVALTFVAMQVRIFGRKRAT